MTTSSTKVTVMKSPFWPNQSTQRMFTAKKTAPTSVRTSPRESHSVRSPRSDTRPIPARHRMAHKASRMRGRIPVASQAKKGTITQ